MNNDSCFKTHILKANKENIASSSELLKNGKLVSFATETVYGLGANCFNKEAVLSIFRYKGRPLSDPLILHVASIDSIYPLVDITTETSDLLQELGKHFWPGPLTIILKANDERISNYITANTGYVSFRIPNHEDALELLNNVDFPIAAPSANKFCHVSPVTAEHVFEDFKEFDVTILDSGKCQFSMESTVIKPITSERLIHIYRKGALSKEDFLNFLSKSERYKDYKVEYYVNLKNHDVPNKKINLEDEIEIDQEAPGQFIKHYSPLIKSYILKLNQEELEKLSKESLVKSVVIDYNQILSKEIKLCFSNAFPIAVLDLSLEGNSDEALSKLYEYLRKAEQIENAEFIILPDFSSLLQGNNPSKETLLDRVEKATSKMALSL